ncbi:MAG: TPM domain-containing protein [Verrucomicrobiales bacterium]
MKQMRQLLTLLMVGIFAFPVPSDSAGAKQPSAGSMFQVAALEQAPESMILDQARLFNAGESAQLSARLKEFHAVHGMRVYVVAYSVLIGETIADRTRLLRDKWLDGDRGIVVGYLRGSDRITFSATGDPLNTALKPRLKQLFTDAYENAQREPGATGRVTAAVELLLSGLPKAFEGQRSAEIVNHSETLSFVTWALALLALLAALGMLAFHLMRRAQDQVGKSYTFPPIKVAERFGAPYSGGHQAEIHFTAPSE